MRLIDASALASILEDWEEKAADGTENDGTDGTTRIIHAVQTTTQEMLDLIAEQTTVDAVPVVHAQWEPHHMVPGFVRCSACRDCITYNEWPDGSKWKYCPECGAKMDGKVETNGGK